jgi:hypothetical protein
MAEKDNAAPDLKVVKPEPPKAGDDLIALASGALAKAKDEIRAEVKKEIILSTSLMGLGLYFLLGGRTPKWLRRLGG